ncbi:MAG: hypothetical protein AB1744_08350 [Candidatus Zixiibacteriota bacterium]
MLLRTLESVAGAAVLCLFLTTCSAIRIETGQTEEEAIESAEDQAGHIRAQFADQIGRGTPVDQAGLLIRHIDTTAARYILFGHEVAREWREGNQGRGREVPDAEMREVVAAWTRRQGPILTAWEDNLEFGLRTVRESRHFAPDFLELLDELADQYYKVYSAVLYPSGSVEDYELAVEQARQVIELLSRRCRLELEKYR